MVCTINDYHVIYTLNFTPNDLYRGKNIIPQIKFDDVEADNEDEAKHKAQTKITKLNYKNDTGSTENRLAFVKIIK